MRKRARPVRAWTLEIDGKICPAWCTADRKRLIGEARWGSRTFHERIIRVEIRPLPPRALAKRKRGKRK